MTTRASFTSFAMAAVALAMCASTAHAVLTHRYSFTADASDSVGAANATLQGVATVGGGQLQMNNPAFPNAAPGRGYLSLPPSILPSSGSVTIEQWFTFAGSGFFTEAWAFTDHNDTGSGPTNPPGPNVGEYLINVISNPQPASPPGGPNTGGNRVSQALSGYAGSLTPPPGGETYAYGTTPGLGFAGGGYLDDGGTYMTATVIDGVAGTLSYYLYRVSDGLGGLQQTVPAIPLSAYGFTNAYLGRSPFTADNYTSGSVDEFRIYNNARGAASISADFHAGPNSLVPEPATIGLAAFGALGLLGFRRFGKPALNK
jgi:hypothetical protein